MRVLVAFAVLAPIVLAGCTDAPEPPTRTIPILRLVVEIGSDTTFAIGEVLGSKEGTVIRGFRFDDDAKTVTAPVPEGATHLYLTNRTGEPAVLVADATRATAETTGSERPAILEFEPKGVDFAISVVQPAECGAIVNNRGSVTNGTGPFRIAPLRALPDGREFAKFALTGEGAEDCAALVVEAQNLGLWTIVPPPRR